MDNAQFLRRSWWRLVDPLSVDFQGNRDRGKLNIGPRRRQYVDIFSEEDWQYFSLLLLLIVSIELEILIQTLNVRYSMFKAFNASRNASVRERLFHSITSWRYSTSKYVRLRTAPCHIFPQHLDSEMGIMRYAGPCYRDRAAKNSFWVRPSSFPASPEISDLLSVSWMGLFLSVVAAPN